MKGLAILLGFNLLGMVLQSGLNVPLPPNVTGLILFTAALFFGWIKLKWVEETARFLLRHMLLFFAPFIVGTVAFVSLIGQQWISIIISLVASTLVVLLVTGWVTQLVSKGEVSTDELH